MNLLTRLRGLPHLNTFLSFGAIQAGQIFLPLLALPWLARVLEPEAFGLLLYMLALSVAVTCVLDWGFNLGAVREAARLRSSPSDLAALLAQVISAKLVLAACVCLLAFLLFPFIPYSTPWGYILAVGSGILYGFNPTWFFQGKGQGMRRMASWDVGSSLLVLVGALLFIHKPEHWPRYLLLLTLCKGSAYLFLLLGLAREYFMPALKITKGLGIIFHTRVLFISCLAAIAYSNGVQLLLGAFLAPAALGVLIASDKIARAVVSLMGPVTQTLFPEVCACKDKAPRLLRQSLFWTVGFMLAATIALWFAAPQVLFLALGSGYEQTALPVLRIMCLLIPLFACNFVLGTQVLVAYGHEKALTKVQLLVAILSLPLAVLLVHYGGLLGAAWVPVLVQGLICSGLIFSVARCCPEALTCPKH